jgi:hypothetical protein
MASTFAVTRNHLIFGLCLPLAVLLGYMLADIDDPASRIVILVALSVLTVPVLMRWYHPLLILSWHAAVQPAMPGNPQLWSLAALLSLFFAVLNRSVNPEHQFAHVPALTRPMVVITAVVMVTAFLSGGIGLGILGSSSVGGRGYFYILAAIAGFFALSSRPIPPARAMLYVSIFFLPGLTAIVSRLAGWVGPSASFVYWLFPADFQTDNFVADPTAGLGMLRVNGSVAASLAVFCWLLARYGVEGVFDLSRPWRGLMLLGAIIGGMFGGYRSSLMLMVAIFIVLFCLEKLWRTRVTVILLFGGILGGAILMGISDRLPLPVQRTLSFLPLEIDSATKTEAEFSTHWRVEMWKSVLPQVQEHLLQGKGYRYSADDLFMVQAEAGRLGSVSFEQAAFTGAYHNGLLSVVIPFGAAGLIALAWLMIAGARFLYTMYQECAPALRKINAFLFALFLARVLFFFFVFGSLFNDLYYFTGILGFSVALNVAGRQQSGEPTPATVSEEEIGQ